METQKYNTMNRTQLATMYQISYPTFKKWLAKIPDLHIDTQARILTPKEVEYIINHLGEPPD